MRDRMSCSIIGPLGSVHIFLNAGNQQSWTKISSGKLTQSGGGVVVSPGASRLLCSYPADGATRSTACHPPGASKTCLPGCSENVADPDTWCQVTERTGTVGVGCGHLAFPANRFHQMLTAYELRVKLDVRPGHGCNHCSQYNEIVLDGGAWVRNMPRTIEAFFFPDVKACDSKTSACQSHVRAAHARFKQHYGVEVPLLRLSLDKLKGARSPFELEVT